MRTESDFIGTIELPEEALYGIHALRAQANFPDGTPFSMEWYKAVGQVKQACYLCAKRFFEASEKAMEGKILPFKSIPVAHLDQMIEVAEEVAQGKYFDSFIVPAVQGGAGTSINMNVNEIIANASLQKLGKQAGDYDTIHPVEQANIFQSTNDVIPTALRVAVIKLLVELEEGINSLRQMVEIQEKAHRYSLRLAYTQMQEAVPSSYGRLFSTYSDALSRDWWRVSKCFERIKTVNLGGSAIGSGITVPRFFIMEATQILKDICGLPITRSENMHDSTANLDSLVEVHAIIKSHAVNLEKISSDLRLLASDVHGKGELEIPQKQVGSSIMPGKVNPVVTEFVISASQVVYVNDMLISQLSAQGCLDLNAYLPVIGHKMIESLKLMIASCHTLRDNMIKDLKVGVEQAYESLIASPAVTTALLPFVGYDKAAVLSKKMQEDGLDIFGANAALGLLAQAKLKEIMKAENLLKEGFSIKEL